MTSKWFLLIPLTLVWLGRRGLRRRRDDERFRQHQEAGLDEALDESFPASDPPSMVSPRGR